MSDEQENASNPEEESAPPSNIGRIEWVDLTVGDAERVKNFYANVVGWKTEDVDMGSYSDFNVNLPDSGDTIAGICHARGSNANIPAQWLMYVRVANVAESAEQCGKRGGKVLDGPRRMGGSDFCVIQDPCGAVMALVSD